MMIPKVELNRQEKATVDAMEALMKPTGKFAKGGVRLVALLVPEGANFERIQIGMRQLLGDGYKIVNGPACAFVNKRGSKNQQKTVISSAERINREQQKVLEAMKKSNTLGPTVVMIETDPGELAQPNDEAERLPWRWEFRQLVYRTFPWPTAQIAAPPQPIPTAAPPVTRKRRNPPMQQHPTQPHVELRAAS